MRALQFWILVLGSTFVSALMIKEIFLSRALIEERRVLVESQATASTGEGFEHAWKLLAFHIYQASANDPALTDLLKKANVRVHAPPAPEAGSIPDPAPSSKPPVAPLPLTP